MDKTGKSVRPMSRSTSLVYVIVLCSLLLALVVSIPAPVDHGAHWWLRAAIFPIFCLLTIRYTRRRYWLPLKGSHVETKVWQLPDDQVYALQRSAGIRGGAHDATGVGDIQTKAFTFAVIEPAMVRQRITERYEPGRRTLTQRVTIEAQMPQRVLRRGSQQKPNGSGEAEMMFDDIEPSRVHEAAFDGILLFPVLVPPKGELINDLRVLSADGSLLPILSYRQYLQVVARVLRLLVCIACGVKEIKESQFADILRVERLALRCIMRRGGSTADPDLSGVTALRELKESNVVVNAPALEIAAQLTEKLTTSYAIVAAVPCPPDGRFVVSYERIVTPRLLIADRSSSHVLGRAKFASRMFLGARPVDVGIDISEATTCQSFHLIFDGQDGVYVGEQESKELVRYCEAHVNRQQQRRAAGKLPNDPPPYFRFLRRAGQRHAHFYTRFFPRPVPNLDGGSTVPSVRFRFYEVPPGSTFRAMVAAIAALTLVWLIGFVITRKPDPGTDAPAFLLVFPALAAGLIGFEARSHRLLEGTLAARLSLLVTAITSLAGSALFMFYKTGVLHYSAKASNDMNPFDTQVLGIASFSWTLLTLTAVLNAACITFACFWRTAEFLHLSRWRGDNHRGPIEYID